MKSILQLPAPNRTRRSFICSAALASGVMLLKPLDVLSQAASAVTRSARGRSRGMIDKGNPIDEVLVFDFVHKSHFDLDMVRQLHAKEPQLVHASWDWGSGDFETGLGAASHMGRGNIALFLIEHGARMNLFAATMLGHLDIARGFLETYPELIHCKGPHRLSLIHHATKGGEPAAGVLAYLTSREPAEAN